MKVLISGGGIGGLTCAFWLKRFGFTPTVVEKYPGLRKEGYMLDFFGSGWDVADRMGLLPEILRERYPIQSFSIVNRQGQSYFRTSLRDIRNALKGKYTYLMRGDLEKILWQSVKDTVEIRFGTSVQYMDNTHKTIAVTFEDGKREDFALVIGADGVHSKVRELAFGPENAFSRYLGYYVAAFTIPNQFRLRDDVMLYQEPNRQAAFYPIDNETLATAYVFRSPNLGFIPPAARKKILQETFKGCGWIAEEALEELPEDSPIFLDSLTQIQMPSWHRRNAVLVGDACGCLTLAAGQGASMAMAGAYLLTQELRRSPEDMPGALQRYEKFLKPIISKKQRQAERFAKNFIPSTSLRLKARLIFSQIAMSRPFLSLTMRFFGAQSILKDCPEVDKSEPGIPLGRKAP